jgi:hypothetical protein
MSYQCRPPSPITASFVEDLDGRDADADPLPLLRSGVRKDVRGDGTGVHEHLDPQGDSCRIHGSDEVVLDEPAAVGPAASEAAQPQLQLGEWARRPRQRDADDGRHNGDLRPQQSAAASDEEPAADEEKDHREVRQRHRRRSALADRAGHGLILDQHGPPQLWRAARTGRATTPPPPPSTGTAPGSVDS